MKTRRTLAPAALLASLVAAALCPPIAAADTSSSLTVVGTSDVSDSGLVANVIQPDFEAQYPQYTFKYVGTATGTAITDAETGSQGASVLIVHAASLENQFVAAGYSYQNQYGYAIFRNDFVLAGPASDPAGVTANAAGNIAQGFADIAAAGIAGKATFVSRGGTPGTTVEEHSIWALVQSSNLAPAGLLLCTVSATNGGGETPIAPGNGVTSDGQECPNSGALPSGSALPSWYVVTGDTQGPNVIAANACTVGDAGANSCYVLTDRGTFDYLASGTDPAGTIPKLEIVTRGPQAATAPGGPYALINYFHAYIVDPTMPNESVNLPAAEAFISMLTSPAFQAQLKTYLDDTSDSAGAPFIADASPQLTATGLPATAYAGKAITVQGSVTNSELGYPPVASQPVDVDEIVAGVPVVVATGVTDETGAFSIQFTPTSSGEYQVATGQISQVENATLSPTFSDVLSPAATTPVYVNVLGGPVPHSLGFRRASVRGTRLTIAASLSPSPAEKGAKLVLFALNLTNGKEIRIASVNVGVGRTKVTVRAKLAAGRYALQLEYTQKGQTSVFSGLKEISVR